MRIHRHSALLTAALLTTAGAHSQLKSQAPIQQIQLQPVQIAVPVSSALMQGMTMLPQGQFQNRIGVMSEPVLNRRLELLGYKVVQPFKLGNRLALGKLQVTQVVSSNVLSALVQKDGVQMQIEIDPFTGLIEELK